MKSRYFRKILPWPRFIKKQKKTRRGTMILISVFVFFIFSTLGLSMLYLTQVYLKLSAYKKNSLILDYASENGIKQGFDKLTDLLSLVSSPSVLSPEKTFELREDARNKGIKIIEEFFGSEFPLTLSESWKRLAWESSTSFYLEKIIEKDEYFQTSYRVVISSEGKIENFRQTKKTTLEAALGILTGHIPLPSIPMLIDKKLSSEEKENFLENNKIEILPSEKNRIPSQVSFSGEELLPTEANSQISKALKTKIFYPQNLSTPQLREALGLEVIDEPVPDGVYLIKDDLGLGGIYVQGDLNEMVLAIEEDFQVISFLADAGLWVLKFSSTKGKTVFASQTETLTYELVPLGIIIVNGEIRSLGGGIVNLTGGVVMVREEEIPCILRGVNLTIISSDKITLSSHLIHQGVNWQKGVPYVKDSNSQLNIFATGKDFLEDSDREGQIVIDEDSPEEIKIQASLTASKNGFSIEGERKTVHILGSLHFKDYASNNNNLTIKFDERSLEEGNLFQDAPKTAKPVLYISFFKTLEWKENE